MNITSFSPQYSLKTIYNFSTDSKQKRERKLRNIKGRLSLVILLVSLPFVTPCDIS